MLSAITNLDHIGSDTRRTHSFSDHRNSKDKNSCISDTNNFKRGRSPAPAPIKTLSLSKSPTQLQSARLHCHSAGKRQVTPSHLSMEQENLQTPKSSSLIQSPIDNNLPTISIHDEVVVKQTSYLKQQPFSPRNNSNKKISPDTPTTARLPIKSNERISKLSSPSVRSPCFVHSQLDTSLWFEQFLERKHRERRQRDILSNSRKDEGYLTPTTDGEDSQGNNSLTTQLAETAVGVREMSKQLGRARIKATLSSIMIITKARDNSLIKLTRELTEWLILTPRLDVPDGVTVYVDHQLENSKRFDSKGLISKNFIFSEKLKYWTADMCSKSPHLFDFVITLGGDGTVLFTSWLFQKIVPPVMPFALGSLGFLTPFNFDAYKNTMNSVFEKGIRVNLRMRFSCTIYRATEHQCPRKARKLGDTGEIVMEAKKEAGWEAIEGGLISPNNAYPYTCIGGQQEQKQQQKLNKKLRKKDRLVKCFATRPAETFEVINDLVVDRGPSPYVSQLELFGDDYHMTTVQADGLCIATPTGSTAYSLSAGGSLVHPEIPAFLITPICPHTLSFRPMLLPDSMEIRICVPHNSRSTAYVSFDGRGRVELKQGDHIKVTASKFPFPTVCADKQSTDWFGSIARTLKWNERERQKSFVVVEEKHKSKKHHHSNSRQKNSSKLDLDDLNSRMTTRTPKNYLNAHERMASNIGDEEDEVSSGEEEDQQEEYDIEDSSPEAAEIKSRNEAAKIQSNHLSMLHHRMYQQHQRPTPSSTSNSSFENTGDLSSTTSSQGSNSPDELKAFAVFGRDDDFEDFDDEI